MSFNILEELETKVIFYLFIWQCKVWFYMPSISKHIKINDLNSHASRKRKFSAPQKSSIWRGILPSCFIFHFLLIYFFFLSEFWFQLKKLWILPHVLTKWIQILTTARLFVSRRKKINCIREYEWMNIWETLILFSDLSVVV